ncbi:MAG: HAD-IA family hydrolase, partial [Nitriliruptoraceae bacterium]
MTTAIRVVAFDLMDTVLTDSFRAALHAATGRAPEELFALRDPAMYPALERGEISEVDYWQHYRDRGVDVDPVEFHRVRRAGIDYIDGMAVLLDGLAGVVERVTASNYPDWIDELATTVLAGRFERIIGSVHLGARKPEPAFYTRLAEAVSVPPSAVAFVDDRAPNVAAARAAG